MANPLQINAEVKHEVCEFDVVNGSEGIHFEDAGDGIGIFELGEPGVRNLKLGIFFIFGDDLAQGFHITCGYAESNAQFSELITGGTRIHKAIVQHSPEMRQIRGGA
jgi:hypothetical protein